MGEAPNHGVIFGDLRIMRSDADVGRPGRVDLVTMAAGLLLRESRETLGPRAEIPAGAP
jgi:hypothetical protein